MAYMDALRPASCVGRDGHLRVHHHHGESLRDADQQVRVLARRAGAGWSGSSQRSTQR